MLLYMYFLQSKTNQPTNKNNNTYGVMKLDACFSAPQLKVTTAKTFADLDLGWDTELWATKVPAKFD